MDFVPLLWGLLFFLGAYVGSSIGYISLRGYKAVGSPSLLKMGFAFILIGLSFVMKYFSRIFSTGPGTLGYMSSEFYLMASILQVSGLFFLALSHFSKAMYERKRLSLMTLIPLAGLTFTLNSISFYLIIYIMAETIYSYLRMKRRGILLVILGLFLLALGQVLEWLTLFYPQFAPYAISSLVVDVLGLSVLVLPTVRFVNNGGMNVGP